MPLNIQDSFRRWFENEKPDSYRNWHNRLNEIKEAYIASFETNVFEIDDQNIEMSINEKINEIRRNMETRKNVPNQTFTEFNKRMSNGIPQAILTTWLIPFLRNYSDIIDNDNFVIEQNDENIEDIEIRNHFTYENDLQKSLISQTEKLFPDYKIFGSDGEGEQYVIGGKRIDLLLEHKTNNELLVIELKAGNADFKVFGQISMYLGLLMEKYADRKITGIIIAGDIDNSLIKASLTNKDIKLMTYKMELSLNKITE